MQQQINEFERKIKLNENEKQRKHIFLSDEEVVMHSKIKKY